MRIAKVEGLRIAPTVTKESWAEGEYVWPSQMPSFLVKVTAEDGCYGIGEATSLESPLRGGVAIEGGRARLPDAPGLGVDVDWAALDRHAGDRQRLTVIRVAIPQARSSLAESSYRQISRSRPAVVGPRTPESRPSFAIQRHY